MDAIVEGSVIREGGRIRVNAQLIRGVTDDHFWSESYDRDLSDAFAHWLVSQGRTREALAWAQRAREHDPLAVSGIEIGWILFHSRRYDEAAREFHSVPGSPT